MASLKDKPKQSDVEVPAPKMKRKEYEKQMRLLHGELVAHPGMGQGLGSQERYIPTPF
jgi:hypothetical protein